MLLVKEGTSVLYHKALRYIYKNGVWLAVFTSNRIEIVFSMAAAYFYKLQRNEGMLYELLILIMNNVFIVSLMLRYTTIDRMEGLDFHVKHG